MSLGIMVTCLAWMVHRFACSINPTINASLASCKANTAAFCSFSPSPCLCTISLTSLWNGTLLIRRSAPFWYFWTSFRACIPLCIFLCFSNLSSLTVFNCLFFLSFICFDLSWFSFLNFFNCSILLSPAPCALSYIAFAFNTFIILAISNNGRWSLFILYRLGKFYYDYSGL